MNDRTIRFFAPNGTEIFREGEAGNCAYVIQRGSVEISTGQGENRRVLARRGVGDIFGEMAVVDSQPRSATVTAVEDCDLLVVSEEQLASRLAALDPILKMVFGVILERFRDSIANARRFMPAEAQPPESLPAEAQPERTERYRTAIERIVLEQQLRVALRERQFVLFFQPLVAAGSGRMGGLEGLIRWRHPERGLLPPGAFIQAMEDSGLIHDVSRWVVEECCRAIKTIEEAGALEPNFSVAVNVTTADIADPDFGTHVQKTLEKYGVPPRRLTLEITESQLMEEGDAVARLMRAYREIGVGLSIDDFGTGYSSLSYLTRYPVTGLKIDKSFVDELEAGEPGEEVIRAMVGLGHALGLKMVAEGVETMAQARLLRRLGCDRLQGFVFSKPAPLAEILALKAKWDIKNPFPEEDHDAFAAAMASLSAAGL